MAIEAYVVQIRRTDTASPDEEAVWRGAEIFSRDEVGCASCHTGPQFTDNKTYTMFGVEVVKTRSLVGIGATAPYLHDGSAETLKALMLRVRDGSMGDTSSLSESEIDDLVAFLRSL